MNTKTLIMMRGIPGSGKSTLAKQIADKHNGVIYSTDSYHMVNGHYQFRPEKAHEYHLKNQDSVLGAMIEGKPLIIVDNTNVSIRDMKPYINFAKLYKYDVEFIEPNHTEELRIDGKWNVDFIHKQQQNRQNFGKNLDRSILERMARMYKYDVSMKDFDD